MSPNRTAINRNGRAKQGREKRVRDKETDVRKAENRGSKNNPRKRPKRRQIEIAQSGGLKIPRLSLELFTTGEHHERPKHRPNITHHPKSFIQSNDNQ